MIVVKLIGGLGNQLFQYAAGLSLANAKNTELGLDISGFEKYKLFSYALSNFKISAQIINPSGAAPSKKKWSFVLDFVKMILKKDTYQSNYVTESSFAFNENFFSLPDDVYLDGYWQSEKYFLSIKDDIRREFVPKSWHSTHSKKYIEQISTSNSVSVHVRRGDYVSNPTANKIHGSLSLSYYMRASQYIMEKQEDPIFYIFSDDLEWCKKNLILEANVHYVSTFGEPDGFIDEFRLMSMCKHHIIANSTFSWWSAWLGEFQDKIVIAPKSWFRSGGRDTSDILPPSWIVME